MKCPICTFPFTPTGGENDMDWCCGNKYCTSRTEISYYPHISVRSDYYFCAAYHLPFKADGYWYALIGPERTFKSDKFIDQTILQTITVSSGFFSMPTSVQKNVLAMTYYALPANNDFSEQFEILVAKAIGLLSLK